MESTARRIRSVNIKPIETTVRHGSNGVVYLSSPESLGAYPVRITDRLEHWAREAPGRVFLAQRDLSGGWRTLTYADALDRVRRVSQALLNRRLSLEHPILILSGNGIDHAILALAAMHVGVPYAPIAPAYSLQAKDYATLQQIFERLKPGLVFAAEGAAFERALAQVLPSGVELVVSTSLPATIPSTPFDQLLAVAATSAVEDARNLVGPDTIAKILFTSGSTG
jgi:feruloyl-CoA synthase